MLSDAGIAQVEERLDALEAKPSSLAAVRELLTRLDAKITEAQHKDYGIAEVVEIVVGCVPGVDADELRKEIRKAVDPKRRKTRPKRRQDARPKALRAPRVRTAKSRSRTYPAGAPREVGASAAASITRSCLRIIACMNGPFRSRAEAPSQGVARNTSSRARRA